jgi:kynurenine formamidase
MAAYGSARYGADDELGAINLITPAKVLQATRLVRTGKVYSLAVVTGPNTPGYAPRKYEAHMVFPGQYGANAIGTTKAGYVDEIVHCWPGTGTHLDGLGHVHRDFKFYGGADVSEVVAHSGLKKFGLHKLPPIVTRAVVLDIAAVRGVDMLELTDVITPDDIAEAEARQGVKIEEGDAVLLHTGWLDLIERDPARFISGNPGIDVEGAIYLAERGVVIIGADQWATEIHPNPDPGKFIPVHQSNLIDYGVYQIQNCRTAELVADKAWEVMLTIGVRASAR